MNGLVSLGDILEKDGYSNTLMIGSDAAFGGRNHILINMDIMIFKILKK